MKAYNSLSIKRKLEIINLVENLPPDKKKKDGDTCSNDDVGDDELPIVTYSHASSAFETVKAFFLHSRQRSNIEPPYDLLACLDNELLINYTYTCSSQTLITDYVNKT